VQDLFALPNTSKKTGRGGEERVDITAYA